MRPEGFLMALLGVIMLACVLFGMFIGLNLSDARASGALVDKVQEQYWQIEELRAEVSLYKQNLYACIVEQTDPRVKVELIE